jgi:sulfate permease, SulP family
MDFRRSGRALVRSLRPERGTVRDDAVAGVSGAISGVPDGMASAVLVGVNPVFGLYASFAAPIAGGLATSTRLMVITTTSAAALAAGSAVSGFSGADRPAALFMLTLIVGAVMVVAGLLHLGRYTRFVSFSVMIGFLTGIAANIIFGQIPDLTGASASGGFALQKALDVVTNPSRIELASLLTGAAALAIMFVLAQTRIKSFSAIIALALPTLATLGVSSIERVSGIGAIPTGVPPPHLPALSFALNSSVLIGAVSVAVIVLVQGVGVSEAAPNPEGTASDPNRDFIAQGVGNLASGLFRGIPVGGSVGRTALNIASGARGRWASIFSGLWMLAILIVFSGIVGKVVVPTLAAVLIYASISSLRSGAIGTILRTGPTSQIGFGATLVATLFLPVATAVAIGVILSLVLQLNSEAVDLRVVALEPQPDGHWREEPSPSVLPSEAVTMLDVYGSLHYAGAKTLAARLPDPLGSTRPVVVLRLRGRTRLGSSSRVVIDDTREGLPRSAVASSSAASTAP